MRRLASGGKPLPPGLFDMEGYQQRLREEARAELEEKKRNFVGNFDTGLPCNCGKANITDHATAHNTKAPPRNIRDIRMGPGPGIRSQNENFRPYHAYSCDTCGAEYRNDVIEQTHGYVPLEKRPME